MLTKSLLALMLALGMLASGAFAQQQATDFPVEAPPLQLDEEDATAVTFPIEDVLSTLMRNPGLIEFHSALQAAQVDLMLSPNEEYTIFAPRDEEFEEQAFDALRTQDALSFYIVPGIYSYQELWDLARDGGGMATLPTLQGTPLTLEIIENQLFIEGAATLLRADLPAQNGVVHMISSVIQPAGTVEIGG